VGILPASGYLNSHVLWAEREKQCFVVKILLQYMLECLTPGLRVKLVSDIGEGWKISYIRYGREGGIFLCSTEDILDAFNLTSSPCS